MANFNSNAAIDYYYQGQKEPVNAQITQANNDYQAALDRLEKMKLQEDAQNYRSYVRQQKEIPGLMRASGNNGGMVDSAIASLANQYNNARANRALNYEANVAEQDLNYGNQMASLRAQLAQYDQMANADKANLAAAQARARARAQEESNLRSYRNRNDDEFVEGYETASGKNDPNYSAIIKAYESGASSYNSNDYINAARNKITPDVLPQNKRVNTAGATNWQKFLSALEDTGDIIVPRFTPEA